MAVINLVMDAMGRTMRAFLAYSTLPYSSTIIALVEFRFRAAGLSPLQTVERLLICHSSWSPERLRQS
jgi:hypothetical protein